MKRKKTLKKKGGAFAEQSRAEQKAPPASFFRGVAAFAWGGNQKRPPFFL